METRRNRWADLDRRDLDSDTVLKARTSTWRTSLPLALESTALVGAAKHYVDALAAGAKKNDRIVGAVFAINGKIEGAEMFQSHTLFREMWPQLLRARAVEALAAKGEAQVTLPSLPTVKAFMAKALDATIVHDTATTAYVRNSDDAVVTETQTRDGNWIHHSFVAKFSADGSRQSAGGRAAVLASGSVGTRAIASLDDRLGVILHREGADGAWTPTIENLAPTPVAINADLGVARGTLATQPIAPVTRAPEIHSVPGSALRSSASCSSWHVDRRDASGRGEHWQRSGSRRSARQSRCLLPSPSDTRAKPVAALWRQALAHFLSAGGLVLLNMGVVSWPCVVGNLWLTTWSERSARWKRNRRLCYVVKTGGLFICHRIFPAARVSGVGG